MALMMASFFSCKRQSQAVATSIDYADTVYWYSCGDESHAADVFYVYPTVSTISFVDNDSSWFADISLPEVRVCDVRVAAVVLGGGAHERAHV